MLQLHWQVRRSFLYPNTLLYGVHGNALAANFISQRISLLQSGFSAAAVSSAWSACTFQGLELHRKAVSNRRLC